MDPRYHRLREMLSREGLTPEEVTFGTEYLEEHPAAQAELLTTLLNGALDERGHTLHSSATVRVRGLLKGRAMLDKVLADHGQTDARPHGPLPAELCAAVRERMAVPDMTCERLLKLLMRTKTKARQPRLAA